MPDWLTVDLFQTLLLVGGTLLAFFAYRAERDARKDAATERKLDLIATRVAELAAAAARSAEQTGMGWRFNVARRNLRSALAASPADLPIAERLADESTPVQDIRANVGDVSVDGALVEIAQTLDRLTA